MSWTYVGPSTDKKDAIRFRIGDTDADFAYLSDEEINFALLQSNDDVDNASMMCCRAIVAKVASQVTYAIGPEKVNASDRYEHFKGVLAELTSSNINTYAAPTAEIPDRDSLFDVGMHDFK